MMAFGWTLETIRHDPNDTAVTHPPHVPFRIGQSVDISGVGPIQPAREVGGPPAERIERLIAYRELGMVRVELAEPTAQR